MSTSSFIKRHIFRLPLGKIFTTREFLLYGSRTAIDQTMSKLARKGVIIRLARGVFVRDGSELENITVSDVAKGKAESFGKEIAAWGGHLAFKLGLAPEGDHEHIFGVNGSSSSFKFGDVTVFFRKVCPRKMRLGTNLSGQLLQALWHLGKRQLDELRSGPISLVWLKRTEREEIRLSLNWLPQWLASAFLHWRLPPAAFHN